MEKDKYWMQRAIDLAHQAHNPSPNPRVGCVIVRDGVELASGFHQRAGSDHAEVDALRKLNFQADGATLFVTLEPCRHQGKTPPCTEAISKSGIARVVYGMGDPNFVAGGGGDFLFTQGVEVVCGICETDCRQINQHWLKSLVSDLPYVTLKLALTTDGATVIPGQKWITGEKSRAEVQCIRARHDAILVGVNTVMADNPQLTVRDFSVDRQPVRVILDPNGKILAKSNVLALPGEIIVVTKNPLKIPNNKSQITNLMVSEFDLVGILKALKKRGIQSVMVEGGRITAEGFLAAGLVDRCEFFYANEFQKLMLWGKEIELSDIRKKQFGADALVISQMKNY